MEQRHIIVLATFLATFCAYVERVGFSIAFTAMAKDNASIGESVKGTVLSAFYWGYGLSQVPGGWAAQLYGGRRVLILCFLMWSTASLLTPSNASSTLAMTMARVCVGVAQGFLIPSVHTVLSQWIPPHERARSVSLTTSGMYLGSAAAMLVLPSVAASFGARSLLKVVGCLGLSWLAMWILVGREIPHRETVIPITQTEVSLAARQDKPGIKSALQKGRPAPTPWRRMLASPAVWAIITNNFAFHYAFYVIMNWLPTYFNSSCHEIIHKGMSTGLSTRDPASSGLFCVLPAVAHILRAAHALLTCLLTICQQIHQSGLRGFRVQGTGLGFKVRLTGYRSKILDKHCLTSSAVALMLMPMASDTLLGVAATTLTLGALGFARGGFSVNHMDIAPKYAGVVMGISNTAGTLSGVIGVAITGRILDWYGGSTALGGWYQAHALAAIICLGATVIFLSFARGDRCFD
ncbi:major facilitator superfamily domain-containing protein [Dunaliella salina]|uniref:Major facilitator superfamily domain-containing protein n=1 Tax=Dunaliella salina TaxID=3046 RepID=A0ABQ7FZF7_DUNSA|nr:major facilitator superfamily domain-containing protein [Dunaliella salina]|eukprot:KAF5827740.1 major facilitator superfamily domain-containing protein [Dunaliella salina]